MQHIEVLVVMNERHDGRAGEKTYKRKSHLLVIFHNCQDSVNCVQDAHGHNRFVLYFLIFFTLKYFTKYFSLWKKTNQLDIQEQTHISNFSCKTKTANATAAMIYL